MFEWIFDHPILVLGFLYWAFSSIKKAAQEADAKRKATGQPPAPPPVPQRPVATRPRPAPPPLPAPRPAASTLAPAPRPAESALSPELALALDAAAASLKSLRARAEPASLESLVTACDALAGRHADIANRSRDPAIIADPAATVGVRRDAAALAQATDALGVALAQREARLLGDTLPLADRVVGAILPPRSARESEAVVGILGETLIVESAARPLLPVSFPLLPKDLGEFPSRWALVAREAWLHRFTRETPLAGEIAALFGAVDPDLWEDQGHRIACQLTGPWGPDLAADAAAALMLGPAYGHALVTDALRRPAASHFTYRPDAAPLPFGQHVPTDLRLTLVIAVLDGAGAALGAEALEARWDAAVPKPPTVQLRTPSGLMLVPRDILLEHVLLLAHRIATTPLVSLRGTIAAAAMAPRGAPSKSLETLEADAAELREGLADGSIGAETMSGSMARLDVVLASLAGLVAAHPDPRRLRAACEASLARVLSVEPGRRAGHARGTHGALPARPTRARARAHAVQQALALGEILTPPHLRASTW